MKNFELSAKYHPKNQKKSLNFEPEIFRQLKHHCDEILEVCAFFLSVLVGTIITSLITPPVKRRAKYFWIGKSGGKISGQILGKSEMIFIFLCQDSDFARF